MNEEQKGCLELAAYSILAGFVGVFVKLVQGLDAYSIVFFRAAIAAAFIFLVVILLKKTKDLSLVQPWKTALVGVFQGASIFLYFSAVLQTSVSNAVFLLYTAPIFSVVLAKFFLKEKIEKSTLIGIALTLLGIIFVLNPTTFSFNSSQTIGNLMALGSGFFYAAMAITAKPILKEKSGFYVAFWQYAVISALFIVFLNAGLPQVTANWWQLGLIGILSTGIAFILFMEGVKKVKGQKIFVFTAVEPLAGSVLALVALNEIPPVATVVGAAFILYGVFHTANSSKAKRVKP